VRAIGVLASGLGTVGVPGAMWVLLGAAVVVLLGWSAVVVSARIRRLDRLHVRTDAARAGLESALERRAAAALAVATVLTGMSVFQARLPVRAETLRSAAAGARAAARSDRETAENVLGRALAGIDRSGLPVEVAEELVDAEQLVVLARRVHNDAVRDTRGLRSRRLVRWLHLAGTAPMPEYFEIVDVGVTTAASHAAAGDATRLTYDRMDPLQQNRKVVAVSSPAKPTTDHTARSAAAPALGTARVKRGMAEMLKGGVIMDVVTPEQAKIAEDAGAVAVMALERVPADIRAQGGVARMSDPDMIQGIIDAVSIPVMAKARIGHFVEAQVLQALGVDYVDESEVLTPADEAHHIDKWAFTVPFVCGATNLGEALRRISEGAAMIRSKGEAGTGNVVEATRHMRSIRSEIRKLAALDEAELFVAAKELRAPVDLVVEVARAGKLPVVLFTAGGIATPADAAMMMQLGAEGVFVGSGIFKSGDPAQRAEAIVKATTFHDDPDVIAKVSRGLGEAMVGINVAELPAEQRYAARGW
jgi:pyridoxal 5'-phosphate synthase pdxS subunit